MFDTTNGAGGRHSALRDADAATSLPRCWPVVAVFVIALTAYASSVFPWGFGPAI